MPTKTIFLAGAGGHTGAHIIPLLHEQGYTFRLLTRNTVQLLARQPRLRSMSNLHIIEGDATNPNSLKNACDGADAVISTLGASLDLYNFSDRRSFHDIDFTANCNLLHEAQRSAVQKFVYLSAFGAEKVKTPYMNEHEAFAQKLATSGRDYSIIQPTGFFYVNAEFVAMAKRGRAMIIGDGSARTNPIHEADVAKVCVDALSSSEKRINIGGAETFTRKEITELAFAALGKKARISAVPYGMMKFGSQMTRPFNQRLGELVEFGAIVATQDCIAPAVSTEHRLAAYFREFATSLKA